MNQNSRIYNLIQFIAIAGNVIFFFWILYNGINEGFQGTRIEIVSYIGLMILLLVNVFLLYGKKNLK